VSTPGASGAPVVELRGLSAAAAPGVPGTALRGLDLRIEAGEHVAVIGASGAGKTSLLMALACAVKPQGGAFSLFGVDPWAVSSAQLKRLRARLFLAPQAAPLPPRQRVVTAVLAGRLPSMGLLESLRTLWHPSQAALARGALAAVGLADKLWLRVDRLSGGERQRVGLARALVSQAELWLVDEPLSALDPARARLVIDALQAAARRDGRTLVCSLHQVDVARACFPRIVALRAGACAYDGPPQGLDDAALRALYAGEAEEGDAALPAAAPRPAALPESMCR